MKRLLLTLFLLASLCNTAESNDFYTHGSFPAPGSQATSAGMRAELDLISAGFDKLPTLSGNANKIVIVNGSGTGLTTVAGTITIPVSLTISGAYGLTWNLSDTTSVTLPTSGTLSTLAGPENLSNKTLVAPTFSGTATGPLTLSGNVNADGTMELTGSGASSIGTSRSNGSKLLIGGTLATPGGSNGHGLNIQTNVTGAANQNVFGALIQPTITTAGGGTHAVVGSLEIAPPTIADVGGSVGTASTLHITGAPTGGSTNYAAWIEGKTNFAGPFFVGSDSANAYINIEPTLTPAASGSYAGFRIIPHINAEANRDDYGAWIKGYFTEAGSGTHPVLASLLLGNPEITNGAASTSVAATLFLSGAPTAGTTNYAIFSDSGLSRLESLMVGKGISRGTTPAQNLAGTCTFSASTTCTVTFANEEPDAGYLIALGCDTQCGRWGSRTTTGFTITTTSSNSGTCHWILIR
jgi:hypothetical protein